MSLSWIFVVKISPQGLVNPLAFFYTPGGIIQLGPPTDLALDAVTLLRRIYYILRTTKYKLGPMPSSQQDNK